MSATAPVAVLGAGIAGLVAGRELARRDLPVKVYEAGPHVAGLAASHRDDDGFSFDTGAHFITNRLAAALGVSERCSVVRTYGESVWLAGRAVPYPTGLLLNKRYLASATSQRLRRPRSPAVTARDHFERTYGRALAHDVAIPLVEAWSGAPADHLSAAVADKIPTGLAETVWLHSAKRVSRRAVAIGYCGEAPQTSAVFHVYPDDGVGGMCQSIADSLGNRVELESPVERIYVEDGRAVGVRVNGVDSDASAVITTAPVHVLPRLVTGTQALDHLGGFTYRPMIVVNLKLNGRGLLPDVVTWRPSGPVFFRATEGPVSMPQLAPAGKTMISCDIGAEVGDHNWAADDDALAQSCLDGLHDMIPDVHDRYLGHRVIRIRLAYPRFLLDHEQDRLRWAHGTGIDGLVSIGRNGEFAHSLMEDVYWRTIRRVEQLATWLTEVDGTTRADD